LSLVAAAAPVMQLEWLNLSLLAIDETTLRHLLRNPSLKFLGAVGNGITDTFGAGRVAIAATNTASQVSTRARAPPWLPPVPHNTPRNTRGKHGTCG